MNAEIPKDATSDEFELDTEEAEKDTSEVVFTDFEKIRKDFEKDNSDWAQPAVNESELKAVEESLDKKDEEKEWASGTVSSDEIQKVRDELDGAENTAARDLSRGGAYLEKINKLEMEVKNFRYFTDFEMLPKRMDRIFHGEKYMRSSEVVNAIKLISSAILDSESGPHEDEAYRNMLDVIPEEAGIRDKVDEIIRQRWAEKKIEKIKKPWWKFWQKK